MTWITSNWSRLCKRFKLTPEQAKVLATVKFPCC